MRWHLRRSAVCRYIRRRSFRCRWVIHTGLSINHRARERALDNVIGGQCGLDVLVGLWFGGVEERGSGQEGENACTGVLRRTADLRLCGAGSRKQESAATPALQREAHRPTCSVRATRTRFDFEFS